MEVEINSESGSDLEETSSESILSDTSESGSPYSLEQFKKDVRQWDGARWTLSGIYQEILDKQEKIEKLREKIKRLKDGTGMESENQIQGNLEEKKKRVKSGNDGVVEAKLSQNIFPEEIWKKVLDNLEDGMDLLFASRTCKQFKRMVTPDINSSLLEKVFPFLFGRLDKQDILKCRQVCRKWCRAVDNYFEDHNSLRSFSDETFNPLQPIGPGGPFVMTPVREKSLTYYIYPGCKLLQKEIMSLSNINKNPFIGRSIQISEKSPRRRGQLSKSVLSTFLSTFGKHIWYLEVSEKVIRHLHALLQNVPNLHNLILNNSSGYEVDWPEKAIKIPDMPKLGTLDIQLDTALDTRPIISPLLKKFHGQIKHLKLYQMDTLRIASKRDWPEVTELDIQNISCIGGISCSRQFNGRELTTLMDCLRKFPNLRKLRLRFIQMYKWGDNESGNAVQELLEMLNELVITAPKFHVLRLAFGSFDAFKLNDVITLPPTLYAPPQLDTLEIENLEYNTATFSHNYAYMLRFPFLKNIKIYSPFGGFANLSFKRRRKEGDAEELVEINNCICGDHLTMYDSFIWNTFPNLNVFTINKDVFTRKGWDQYYESME